MLFNLLSFVDLMSNSMLKAESATGLTYTPPNATDPSGLYITFSIYVVMMVGLYGSIYGCILLKRTAEDGKQFWPAITHLIGGMLGINIVTFLNMMGNSMGTAVASAVSALIGQ